MTKRLKAEINVKHCTMFFGVMSIAMFIFMFFDNALIDDGAFHIGRLGALASDISWNNLKPWIYSKTNFGTGYPLGIFYPDLFLYPFALLAKTPIGIYPSYVIMMMSINFASVTSFYLCVRKIIKYIGKQDYEGLAFVMALMYLAYPYRLWCLYGRMAIGECMFFVFFPIIMLGIYEIFYYKKFSLALFAGMTGMIHSHILSTAICICLLIIFYIINFKKIIKEPKILKYTLINAVLTILCGLSVLLPILEMQNFTELYYMTGTKTFGKVVGHSVRIINNDELAIVTTIIAVIVCSIIAYKGKVRAKLASVSIFVMVMWTDLFCWGILEDIIPEINMIQFPFRLLGIAGFTLSVLGGLILYKHKPLYISYVIIMVLGIYALIMGRYVSLDNIDIFAQYSVGKGEYITKELREFIVANGEVPDVKNEYNIENSGDVYSFEAKDGNVVLPLAYYKGYKISDSKKVYEYTQDTGLIKVEGVDESQLKVEYKGTITQKVSLAVSLATFIGILSGCLFKRGKYERKNK